MTPPTLRKYQRWENLAPSKEKSLIDTPDKDNRNYSSELHINKNNDFSGRNRSK